MIAGLGVALLPVGCQPQPGPVLDVEVEAARNTRNAGIGVVPPAVLAQPDRIARCRHRWTGNLGEFRYDTVIDADALDTHLERARKRARRWSPDAKLIRLEVTCDPTDLALALSPSWFSRNRAEVWHAPSPLTVTTPDPKRPRPELTPSEIHRALTQNQNRWRPTLIIDKAP